MYKIYYNDKAISLLHTAQYEQFSVDEETSIKVHYSGKTKFLLSCIDKIEKNIQLKHIFIFFKDVRKLKSDFFLLFRIVEAAGGLVLNPKSNMLLIFRRGMWDLPKGKMEKGETKKESAIREVQEETGLNNVEIIHKLPTTYHIYIDKQKRRVIKPSYWYLMFSTDQKLTPQTEEDIERVEWLEINSTTIKKYVPIHSNIKDVLDRYLNDMKIFK